MIISISTTRDTATDLGFLLHKNPARIHTRTLSFGKATVFYPKADVNECEAVLIVEVDPIALVRKGARGRSAFGLGQYVNDRPYAASSFLSVAIAEMFGTAMNGRCKDRPELVDVRFPITLRVPTLPVQGGAETLDRLFKPVGPK